MITISLSYSQLLILVAVWGASVFIQAYVARLLSNRKAGKS